MNLSKFSMPAFSSVTAVLAGGLVLVGWMFDNTTLKSVGPGLVTMKVNTALAFILAGASLWLLRAERIHLLASRIAQACAAAVTLVGLFTLVEYLFGSDLGIDQMLFEEAPGSVGTSAPGRMGFNTALSFLALGVALLLLAVEVPWRHWLAQILASIVALLSLLAVLGYAFNLEFLYAVSSFTPMALHTAITFTLLSFGVLLARSGQGLMRIFTPSGAEAVHSPYAWLPYLMIGMVLATLVSMTFTLHYIETRLVASTGESLALAAASITDKLDLTLRARYDDIQVFTQAAAFQGHDPKAKSAHVTSLQERNPSYLWIGVTDARGTIIAATNQGSIGQDRSAHEWFRAARDSGKVHVRDAEGSEDSGGVIAVGFTAPITGPGGEFLGVVTTRLGLPAIEGIITNTTRTLQFQRGTGTGRIEWQFMTRDGDVIVDSILRQEGTVNLKTLGLPSALLIASATPGYIEEMHLRRHVPVITGYAQTEQGGDYLGLHWGVLVRMDRKDVVAPIHDVLWKLGVAGVVLLVPTIGLLLWATGKLRQEWAIAQEETARATAAETQTRLIVDTALDAVVVMDGDGMIRGWNPQAESTFGWSRTEVLGRSLSNTIIPVEYREAHLRGLKRFLATGEGPVLNKRLELTALHRDGHEFPIELTIAPLRSAKTVTFSAFVRDITVRKQAEAELKAAKDAAEAANVAKSEFLASMSHEIRTPMNAIIGMADLLVDTPLSAEQAKYVQIFRRAGDNLLNLINDILDLSKVEAAQLELDRTGFDLTELVEKVAEMLALRAHEKCLELACHIAPEVPAFLIGDPARLRQVLVNLLGNAIKFTESGEVVLRVTPDPDSRDPGTLRFTISDTGIGIPPDKIDVIFDRFTQADSSTTRKYGGTGLGLDISKRLVELMGGRIWVESRLGFGSTFSFTARLEVQPLVQMSPNPVPVKLPGLRALVVDDNDTNRLILTELLRSWGAVVTEAAEGKAALAEMQRAQSAGEPYELALLDCRMPAMDGFQLAKAIRTTPTLTGVAMMMLTSDNRKEHIQRALDLGLAGYVVKPIRRAELLEAVARAVANRPTAGSPAPAEAPSCSTAATHHAMSILLAEDSLDNRLLIQHYLKKTPHHLEIADNGAIAVAKYRARSYDLVLMDMQMPVMDGYAAVRTIRTWEAEQGRSPTPIIALTAHALQGDEAKAMEAGCTAYLAKPIKKTAFLAALAEYQRPLVS